MKITVEPDGGKFGGFHVNLHSKDGAEPFLTIKSCKLIDNNKGGRFVSFPAKKLDSGKYWNHCWASDNFQEAVKDAWDEQIGSPKPAPAPAAKPAAKRQEPSGFADMDSDVPF